jgi:hypothetical protein
LRQKTWERRLLLGGGLQKEIAMTRVAFTLSVAAVLAGCATEHRVAPAPAPVVVQPAPTAGAVVVPPAAPQPLRVGIRMDDGTVQYVDTAASGLATGDRVSITSDGTMRHPAP